MLSVRRIFCCALQMMKPCNKKILCGQFIPMHFRSGELHKSHYFSDSAFRSVSNDNNNNSNSGKKRLPPQVKKLSIAVMDEAMAREELINLNDEINVHDRLYYGEDTSVMTDTRYDRIVRRADDLIGKFQNLSHLVDKFNRVAYQRNFSFKPFVHSTPLLSLANAFNDVEVGDFLKKCEAKIRNKSEDINSNVSSFVIEPKIDGLSLALHYKKGVLVGAGTRGNGNIGEDVSENVEFVQDIPKSIPAAQWDVLKSSTGDFEIRGEAYMSKFDFETLNKERISANLTKMSTARNTAAGALRQIDASITKDRKLRFFAYCLLTKKTEGNNDKDQSWVSSMDQLETLNALEKVGFSIASPIIVATDINAVTEACKTLNNQRATLPYDSDGAVIKVNSVQNQHLLGKVSRFPNWAVAFKFTAEEAETELLAIDIHVGRTGVLTPVARLAPVCIGGVIVSRATLHNESEVARLGIKPGNIIRLKRAGDVIPKVMGPGLNQSTSMNYEYKLPSNCPVCNSVTEKLEGGTLVRCTGFLKCPSQVVEHIHHFCSRDACDIDGLGHAKINELYSVGIIKSIVDIYKLREADLREGLNATSDADKFAVTGEIEKRVKPNNLRTRKGWGDRSVNNLLAAIDARRKIPFDRFMFALGVRHVGLGTSRLIASHFGQFTKFWKYLEDEVGPNSPNRCQELLSISGIGQKVVDSLMMTISDAHQRRIIDELLREIDVESVPITSFHLSANAVKKDMVVISGKLNTMTRLDAEELCRKKVGVSVSSRLSKATTILVCDKLTTEKPTAKLIGAQKLGIRIMDEQTFVNWLQAQV